MTKCPKCGWDEGSATEKELIVKARTLQAEMFEAWTRVEAIHQSPDSGFRDKRLQALYGALCEATR